MAKIIVIFACEECDLCVTEGYLPSQGYCIDLEARIPDIGKFHADCKLGDAKDKYGCPRCTKIEEE